MKVSMELQHQQHFFSWSILVNSFFLLASHATGIPNSEAQLLLQFKNGIQFDPHGMMANWNANDESPCAWNGVSCSSDGNVVSLGIPRAQLQGSLPSQLGGLSHLRHLNLHDNLLHSNIPSDLFNASQLQSLFLFSNNLSGDLPQQIGKLTQLQYLDLSHNSLTGNIPNTISNCTRLHSLRLSQSYFSGPIPQDIGSSLLSLRELDLSGNLLSNSIPASLGELHSLLGTLNLSHNQLSGPIPESLGSLPLNVSMDFSNNNLSGPIPRNGALARQGRTAFLGNNGLCGDPLQNLCSRSPILPVTPSSSASGSKSLSRGAIVAISIGDAAGIAFVGLVLLYCYWRRSPNETPKPSSSSASPGGASGGVWLCTKNVSEGSPNFIQGHLMPLDDQVSFDLDELLRASAYVLGKSGVGIVYKVLLSDLLTVAVRRLGEGGSQRFKEFQAEVETIGRIRHPNIVSLRAYYWATDEKLLVYDFIPNGSMVSALHGQSLVSSEPLKWSSRLKIARGTARGLAYIHEWNSKKCVHGDIKPSNILLDLDMEPYVADFGLSRLLSIAGSGVPTQPTKQESSQSSTSTLGPYPAVSPDSYYRPPESARNNKPTQKWDVYSYGMIVLELLTGKSHVEFASSDVDLAEWIKAAIENGKPLLQIIDASLVDEIHRADQMLELFKIALSCVGSVPDRRPSMTQVTDSLDRIGAAPR